MPPKIATSNPISVSYSRKGPASTGEGMRAAARRHRAFHPPRCARGSAASHPVFAAVFAYAIHHQKYMRSSTIAGAAPGRKSMTESIRVNRNRSSGCSYDRSQPFDGLSAMADW